MRDAELEPLAKTLFRLPEIKLVNVERWTQRDVEWGALIDDPKQYQREFIRLDGMVHKIAVDRPVLEIQEKWGLDQYFRCELILAGGQPAVVYARTVPESWQRADALPALPSRRRVLKDRTALGQRPTTTILCGQSHRLAPSYPTRRSGDGLLAIRRHSRSISYYQCRT